MLTGPVSHVSTHPATAAAHSINALVAPAVTVTHSHAMYYVLRTGSGCSSESTVKRS